MMTLLTGGAGSGKSEWAERLAVAAGGGPRVYVATMQAAGAHDQDFQRRVARHRALRAGKGFMTVECPLGLNRISVATGAVVLLECLSNLAANELFAPDGAGNRMPSPIPGQTQSFSRAQGAYHAILDGIAHLCAQASHVFVVTNELFSDGQQYDSGTEDYLWLLGALNRELALQADRMVEVVFGLPIWQKGREELF